MKWALNEIEGMVKKAARGAGFPVGQAEDLGRIAAYLAGSGGDLAPVTAALSETLCPVVVNWHDDHVAVSQGPAALIAPIVRDAFTMGYRRAELATPTHAALVGAFLAEGGMAQKWNGATVTVSDTTVLKSGCGPVAVPQADWQVWSTLAARTYVPETQSSRAAGAGAGLTDND